jgi:hypothetical protein
MKRLRTIAVISLILLSSTPAKAMPAEEERNPRQESSLEVLDVKIDPVREGKNVLHVKIRNSSQQDQAFGIHIQTLSGNAGWGTAFFETIKAGATDSLRFAFRLREPMSPNGYVRLQFYNPPSPDPFKLEFANWFLKSVYRSSDLQRRSVEDADAAQVSRADTDNVIRTFKGFQAAIKSGKLSEAWTLCTRDYLQADQIPALTRLWESSDDYEPEDLLPWDMYQLVELQPGSVWAKGSMRRLKAPYRGETWMIDFARSGDQWKIDWISGYAPPRPRGEWKQRLLPRMEKRSTKHFDIYYFQGSTAEKEIAQIAETKERGFREICRFLGKDSDVRICMVLFETEGKKRVKTGHQGSGWAFGNTIVEVYNEKQRMDPYHETAHILMGPQGNPPAIFNEGFAVYMSKELGSAAAKDPGGGQSSIHAQARELKEKDDWIDLDELLTYSEIGPAWSRPPVAYPEAASFVKFLIDAYGQSKFLQAYQGLQNSGDKTVQQQNREKLQQIYNKPLGQLEQEWQLAFAGASNGAKSPPASSAPTTPAQAITATFLEFQHSIRDEKYETAWGILAKSLRSQYQDDFGKWKQQISSRDARAMFLNLQPGSVAAEDMPGRGKVYVLAAKSGGQAWRIYFIQEDGRWRVFEAQVDKGAGQDAPPRAGDQAALELPTDFSIADYVVSYGSRGIDYAALSDPGNSSILKVCLTPTSEQHLKSLAVPDLQARLRGLEGAGLIAESNGSYRLAFPAIVGPKRARLQQHAKQAAAQLMPLAESMTERIRGHLKDRQEMLYHVLWSCIMDGSPAWNAARSEMLKQISAGDTSIDNKTWLIYPPHPSAVGTNSYDISCGHLRITWNRNTPNPHTIRRVIVQHEDDLAEAIDKGHPVKAITALHEAGLVDEAGRVQIYTLDSTADADLIQDYTKLGKEFGRKMMAQFDTPAMSNTLQTSPGVVFLIAYHEICWQLLENLTEKQALTMPSVLSQTKPDLETAYQLVSLVRGAREDASPGHP